MLASRSLGRGIRLVACAVATASMAGCVSSGEHQRLERQLTLSRLEFDNARHAKTSLEEELAKAQTRIEGLEKSSLASASALDEERENADRVQSQLAAFRQIEASLRELAKRGEIQIKTSGEQSTITLPSRVVADLMQALPTAAAPDDSARKEPLPGDTQDAKKDAAADAPAAARSQTSRDFQESNLTH